MGTLVKWLGAGLVLLVLAATGLWIADQLVVATALAAFAVALLLLFVFSAGVAVGEWHNRIATHEGADLVLRAQDINDRWDAQKTTGLARFAQEMAKLAERQERRQGDEPEDAVINVLPSKRVDEVRRQLPRLDE